jgi:hypothetical protein
MSPLAEALRGRRVTGVIALSPRSLAVVLAGRPRRGYLWIHLGRKEAEISLATDLPIPPDPRGSPFGALETAVRGRAIAAAEDGPRGGLVLSLAEEAGAHPTHALSLTTEGPRVNLLARSLPEGTVLWAHHREESPPGAPPPGFHPPRVVTAATAEEREALRSKIEEAFREDYGREVRKSLDAAQRVLERRVAGLTADRERARERLMDRRRAEILLAHYPEIRRGASRVGLPDPYADSPGTLIEIQLDPALSPHENAARLFRRAKRGERGEQQIEDRLARTRKSLSALTEMRRVLPTRLPKDAIEALDAFLRESEIQVSCARGDQREDRLRRRTTAAPRAGRPGHRSPGAREAIRPRTFVTSDGWEVWVGRSNTENDLITHRLSSPHDYWFHVVGVPGSHVILRRPSRNAIPKSRTLGEAASIAAFYSKARKLTRVPVIYTERKFVSKPRRGKPGQAICTRERELLVRPHLPSGGPGTTDTDGDREVSS